MNLTNKYTALEKFRVSVLPRVIEKYEVDGMILPTRRKRAWGRFISFLQDKGVISEKTRLEWELSSDWTSHYFISDLVNLKPGEGQEVIPVTLFTSAIDS